MRIMKKLVLFILILPVLGMGTVFSQNPSRSLGAILDEASYNNLPRKASLATRAYEGLPKAVSLKRYAPLPGDQTDYGTCVAWAAAYAARTISESVALNRINQTETTQSAFSPVYVYRTIQPDDAYCQEGAQIYWALDLMKSPGAVKMLDIERRVDFPRVDISLYQDSKRYPIADYVTLFSRDEDGKPGLITRSVKKSLAEGKPVIIGMNTPQSFIDAESVWQPVENPAYRYGGHALCVIGYDDERNGGVFEVINSWGRKWGNGGYMWIPYTAFTDFVMEGYEMIENLATYSDTVKFAAYVRLEVFDGSGVKDVDIERSPRGFYRTTSSLGAGAEFRYITGVSESAYVYAFAATQTPGSSAGDFYSPVQLFPQPGVSPLLNYSGSAVALPGEDTSFELDDVPGMEHLVLLYAKQALDIRNIMRRFESARGTVNERLSVAVGGDLLPADALSFSESEAAFTVETANTRAVASLILSMDHR
jgi:hypothetical protein